MKYCSQCGKEIVETAGMCPYCGTPCNDLLIRKAPMEPKSLAIATLVFGILGGGPSILFGLIGLKKYKTKENRRLCIIGMSLFLMWVAIFILLFIINMK